MEHNKNHPARTTHISVEYCAVWNYTPHAVSLAAELLDLFSPYIASLTLIPSGGGRFEVTVNGDLIFSKQTLGRHAEPGEIVRRLRLKTGLAPMPHA